MMTKLYQKSEILFAIFWIVLYTVSMGYLRNLGDDSPFMMIGQIVISAMMPGPKTTGACCGSSRCGSLQA